MIAFPGSLVSTAPWIRDNYPTGLLTWWLRAPKASVFIKEKEVHHLISHVLPPLVSSVVCKQVTRLPTFKGKGISLYLLMERWQVSTA